MIQSFSQLIESLRSQPRRRIVIAGAEEEELLLAHQAVQQGLADFILIGDQQRLEQLQQQHQLAKGQVTFINETDHNAAARLAVHMVVNRDADLPMKGLMHTGAFLKAVLDKTNGLSGNSRLSQITIFEGYNGGLQFLTDCAINIKPTLQEKKTIIENSVYLAQRLGYDVPLVALLGSVETVSESMPDTLESAILTQMNRRGQIKGCLIDGPLSLDNAICPEAAKHKEIDGPVAGKAHILVAAELQVANTFSKALNYYAGLETASVIIGTRSPIIMTSRTDKLQNKLNSIAASCYLFEACDND